MQQADYSKALAGIRSFLLDMDGTIYLSDTLIEGTQAFLNRLEQTGRRYLFVTNNSSKNAAHYQRKLAGMGIEVEKSTILTSGQAAGTLLLRDYPHCRVWVMGNESLKEELSEQGVQVVERGAQVVLCGYDTTLTYEKLCTACDLIRAGLPYLATHPDLNCPVQGGCLPDLGSFMALIEASTGRKPDRIAGKPERGLIDAACARLGQQPGDMAMCGDRLYTDIAAGKRHGLLSILVLSGETDRESAQLAELPPDIIVDRLESLIPYL